MEFKGTKGPWRYSDVYQEITATEFPYLKGSEKICTINANVNFDCSGEKGKANALLISKAPEMLGMIEELIHLFEYSNNSQQEVELLDQAKQLIKEATEL